MPIKIQNRYKDLCFEDLIETEGNRELINYYKDYIKHFEDKINSCENVIITSGVGLGKTFITKIFLNELEKIVITRELTKWNSLTYQLEAVNEESKIRKKYILMADLINELRKEYKGEQVDRELFECDLLVIDEAGVQFGTEAERQIIFNLVNYRYENYKPIILISNYPIESTDKQKGLRFILGERIMDRINDKVCKVFVLKGQSFRKK